LSDGDAGQQKNSEQCAVHDCHILKFRWNSIVTKTVGVVIHSMDFNPPAFVILSEAKDL
jgi:hypothetical protein